MKEFPGIAAVVGWFFYLTHRALAYGFNPDDEMNMNFAMARPLKLNLESIPFFWNGYIRPMGSIFYLVLYRMFGYWARPYRIATLALIVLNLVLLYRLVKRMTNSRAAAFLAILAGCFHREMWDIYASTGTVYDILCQSFILLVLLIWVKPEAPSRWLTPVTVALLTVGAVESKEMGVAIPAILLVYDFLFRRKSIRFGAIGASSVVAALFLAGRFAQPTAVTGNAAYTPVLTVAQYLMTTQWYLDLLLYKPGLSEVAAVLSIAAAGALALLLRSRIMLFGLAFYLLALLPMSFAPPRPGYALYVPWIGALLFLIGLYAKAVNTRVKSAVLAAAALAFMTMQFQGTQSLKAAQTGPAYLTQLEALSNGARRAYPKLPAGARLTLIDDPFPDPYIALFTLRALYDNPTLTLDRIRWNPARGPEQLNGARYTLFFTGMSAWAFGTENGNGEVIDGRPRQSAAMWSPWASFNIASGVAGEPDASGARWAFADPEFVFTRPAGNCQFVLEYQVPGAVLDRTGPLRLIFNVEGADPDLVVISRPGQRSYAAPVPDGTGPLVHVKVHAENPYIGTDGVKLSFLVTWAGLRALP